MGVTGNHDNIFCATKTNTHNWCLDSGATSHFCKDHGTFQTLTSGECEKLNLASSAQTPVIARGTAHITAQNENDSRSVSLENT